MARGARAAAQPAARGAARAREAAGLNELRIALRNCHGIGAFNERIDFADGRRHLAVYASNGAMKSSLAKTFRNVRDGVDPSDHIYTERPHSCSITDENKNAIDPSTILVVDPYDDAKITADMSLDILVDPGLRADYARATGRIRENRQALLDMLHKRSGIPKRRGSDGGELEELILNDTGAGSGPGADIYAALATLRQPDQRTRDVLSGVRYRTLFNEKTEPIWGDDGTRALLDMYFERYVQLLEESPYLSRDFDHTGADTVAKSLDTHGYFKAGHSLSMRRADGKEQPPIGRAEYRQAIKDDLGRIEEGLREQWGGVDHRLSGNKEARELRRYLETNRPVVPMLHDIPGLKRSLWECYLADAPDLVSRALGERREAEAEMARIARAAEAEQTVWEDVVETFNRRFDVPFEVSVTNKARAVMGASPPNLAFTFDDGRGDGARTMEQDDLYELLSMGEKRAFFLLNILFEVEKRRKSGQETVMILDDIADSFDYRNKYAIIEYLRDISAYENFHIIILTHNYDFFRAVNMRGVVGGPRRCRFGCRDKDGRVRLRRIPRFDDPLERITSDEPSVRTLASAIPFARNIAEYTLGKKDKAYTALSDALHWRARTAEITVSEIAALIRGVLPQSRHGSMSSPPPEAGLLAELTREADAIAETGYEMDLYGKITVSIAARLHAEKFMCSGLFKAGVPPDGDRPTTQDLVRLYKAAARGGTLPATQGRGGGPGALSTLDRVALMTPEIIHVNSFMFEPILDMSGPHLAELYLKVRGLAGPGESENAGAGGTGGGACPSSAGGRPC